MNRDELKKIFLIIQAVYPNWNINQSTFEVWGLVLGEYEAADVQAAVVDYLKSPHGFAPSPGQINATIIAEKEKKYPDAISAFELIKGASSEYSKHRRAQLPEHLKRFGHSIGWQRIAQADVVKELPWIFKEFEKMYSSWVRTTVSNQSTTALPTSPVAEKLIGIATGAK